MIKSYIDVVKDARDPYGALNLRTFVANIEEICIYIGKLESF